MIALSLGEVAAATGGRLDGVADPTALVTAVVADSREVAPGALFAALVGERVDGHDFAAAAVAAGATAVLAARPLGVPAIVVPAPPGPPPGAAADGGGPAAFSVADPVMAALGRLARLVRDRSSALVVGVTGSTGKTSTKDLLADVFGAVGPTVAAVGSFNNDLGLPLTVLRAEVDTKFLVLEMGARGRGHIARLCDIARPDIGVVLNVGTAHVGEYPDGRVGIAAAKGELAEAAGTAAVLNADDPLVAAMATRARARVLTFGTSEGADVRAERITLDDRGRAAFDLVAGGEREAVALNLVGEHHVANALAAAAVATAAGLRLDVVAAALSAAEPRSRWRMEVADAADGVTVVNDAYNANPESTAAALRALATLSSGRRSWAVLGEMAELGSGADDAHEQAGRLAAELGVDRVVAVGTGARGVGCGAPRATLVRDADAATALLQAELRPGDVVLVKGSRVAGLERVAAALLDADRRTASA